LKGNPRAPDARSNYQEFFSTVASTSASKSGTERYDTARGTKSLNSSVNRRVEYFYLPEGEQNLLMSKKEKKAYPAAKEPKHYKLNQPDERFRKHVFENNQANL
jgi:hypothetical protein